MVWDWIIAAYLFLAGMGAGAFVLSSIVGWRRPGDFKVKLAGLIIALVAVGGGTLLLMVDARAGLANPLRFFGLLSNTSSIMMWGVVLLSAFLLVDFVAIVLEWRMKKTPKALDVVGMAFSLGVAGYTGALLGDAHLAFPLWNPVILPVLFVVSAASAGFAVVVLAAHIMKAPELDAMHFAHITGLAFPLVEAALIVALLCSTCSVTGSAASAAATSVANLTTGAYAVAFWIGLVCVGLAVPFALELAMRVKSGLNQRAVSCVAECCVLVGGFMLRYLVIMAALPTAMLL